MPTKPPLPPLLASLLLAAVPARAEPAKGRGTLVLETIVVQEESKSREFFGRMGRYLAERVGLDFKLVVAPDYLSASEDLRRGAADVAYLSPLLACKTRRWDPDVQYLATSRANTEGAFQYRAILFVRAGSGITSLDDASGLALGLVNEESAAGYHFPLARILDLGLDPTTHFRKVYLLGSHKAVVAAVGAGTLHVGAAFDSAIDRYGEGLAHEILEFTDPIPSSSLLAAPYVPPDVVERLRAALLDDAYVEKVTEGAPREAIGPFPSLGWGLADDATVDAPCVMAGRVRAAMRKGLGR